LKIIAYCSETLRFLKAILVVHRQSWRPWCSPGYFCPERSGDFVSTFLMVFKTFTGRGCARLILSSTFHRKTRFRFVFLRRSSNRSVRDYYSLYYNYVPGPVPLPRNFRFRITTDRPNRIVSNSPDSLSSPTDLYNVSVITWRVVGAQTYERKRSCLAVSKNTRPRSSRHTRAAEIALTRIPRYRIRHVGISKPERFFVSLLRDRRRFMFLFFVSAVA